MNQCVVCGAYPVDRHHIKSKGSGGSNDDLNLVHLCRIHHNEIHTIGPYRTSEKYPSLKKYLNDAGFIFKYEFGVMKLRRL